MKYWQAVSPKGTLNQKIHLQTSAPTILQMRPGSTNCGMGLSGRDVQVEQIPENAEFCKRCTKNGIVVAAGSTVFSLHPESGSVLYLTQVP